MEESAFPAVVEAVAAPDFCPTSQSTGEQAPTQHEHGRSYADATSAASRPLPIMIDQQQQQQQRAHDDRPTQLIVGRSMVNIQGSVEEGWGEAERLMTRGQGTPPLLHMMRRMAPVEAASS